MPTKKSHTQSRSGHNWVRTVTSVSTFPPEGLFTKDAETVARGMASRKVSPKGIASGIRMIQYFINRGGRGLPAARKRELEKAKRILQAKLHTQRGERSTKSGSTRKSRTTRRKRR
jgi:hypothetical protein